MSEQPFGGYPIFINERNPRVTLDDESVQRIVSALINVLEARLPISLSDSVPSSEKEMTENPKQAKVSADEVFGSNEAT